VRRYQILGRSTSFLAVGICAVAASLLAASGCGGDPAAPTPVPTPDPLAVTCPAPVSQPSPTGQPVAVRYGTPTATGGTPPVQIACTPAADTLFSVGRTTVTCNAADTKGLTGSCSFTVTVTAPPTISLTQFLAFGDSMTAGEITVVGEGGTHTLQLFPGLAYPTDLQSSLRARYSAQPILVTNGGLKGETTTMGLTRLQTTAVLVGEQVLLLMEGANDINQATDAQVQTALSNIRAMVRLAKGRGVRVFLATLPPQNPAAAGCSPLILCRAGGAQQLPNYNLGLRQIAASESVGLVDVFAAFTGDLNTLIGPDGLHPTAGGYLLIANTFFDAIRAALEVAATTTATPTSLKSSVFVVPKR
jgi:lysophospholipase L1-like esterase